MVYIRCIWCIYKVCMVYILDYVVYILGVCGVYIRCVWCIY